jgi:alpha-L-rhamnosidase
MNSFNHFALGAVGEWMFEYQLGITAAYDEGEAGYRHFVLQPSCGGIYTALEGSYDSNYGRICSAWTADQGVMKTYRCTVPANTTATLYLPIDEDAVQTYGEVDGAVHEGNCTRLGHSVAQYILPAGTWEFTIGEGRIDVR